MNYPTPSHQTPYFLTLSVSMITCLILLINISFKIISIQGLVVGANSLLCPLITMLYLFSLQHCSIKEQRHLLNLSVITLYIFCIGVYLLVNLPASEYMHDNPVYQIIFEDIPKKFFATIISFVLSFYVPHLLFCSKPNSVLTSPKQCVLLALLGGLAFICMDFFLLFSGPHSHSFKQIFIDSLMISSVLLLLVAVFYLTYLLEKKVIAKVTLNYKEKDKIIPMYHYLICFAVTVMLMCLACEYRIVALSKNSMITASALFFPITLVISTIIGELWGYKANLKLALILIITQIVFDGLLMGLVALPSPTFYNLTPFYNYIMPRRLPAASFALLVTFISNAMLLHYLKASKWGIHRPLRILVANIFANSLLCLVNYSLLFGGIYPYEQLINLIINVWQYKLLMTIIFLPFIHWFCKVLEERKRPAFNFS